MLFINRDILFKVASAIAFQMKSSSSRQVISWLPGPGIYPAAVEAREWINFFSHLMVVDGFEFLQVFQQGKRQT